MAPGEKGITADCASDPQLLFWSRRHSGMETVGTPLLFWTCLSNVPAHARLNASQPLLFFSQQCFWPKANNYRCAHCCTLQPLNQQVRLVIISLCSEMILCTIQGLWYRFWCFYNVTTPLLFELEYSVKEASLQLVVFIQSHYEAVFLVET